MHPKLPNRKYFSRQWITLFGLTLIFTGCASSPSKVPIEDRQISSDEGRVSSTYDYEDSATPYEERSYEVTEALRYEELAQQGSSSEAIDAKLSAAEFYIQAADAKAATQVIDGLYTEFDRTQMDEFQMARLQVIVAYIDYQNGYYHRALQSARQILSREDTPGMGAHRLKVDSLLLVSLCQQALGNMAEAIESLISREAILTGRAKAETTRYIWQVINALSPEERQIVSDSTASTAVRNRIEQSMAGQVSQADQQPIQFERWRKQADSAVEHSIDGVWDSSSASRIAILLPTSSRFSKAAQAVADGIDYQHSLNESPFRPQLRYFDIGANPLDIPRYYEAARQQGAQFIIGPLGKDYANQLNQYLQFQSSTPTLLLGGDTPMDGTTMRLTLSPEHQAEIVAERAIARGYVNAAILIPETSTGQRVANAFYREWLRRGGKISKSIPYSTKQFDHSTELTQLFDISQSHQRHRELSQVLGFKPEFAPYRRKDIDFIFMIAETETARILRPQINFFGGTDMPVLSTSAVYDGIVNPTANLDLEGTAFPAMPWVLASKIVSVYAGQLNMLFALGADAYQLAAVYPKLRLDSRLALNGNSGQLRLADNNEFKRSPIWARFIEGIADTESELMEIEINNRLEDAGETKPDVYYDGSYQTPRNTRRPRKEYNDKNWDPGQ